MSNRRRRRTGSSTGQPEPLVIPGLSAEARRGLTGEQYAARLAAAEQRDAERAAAHRLAEADRLAERVRAASPAPAPPTSQAVAPTPPAAPAPPSQPTPSRERARGAVGARSGRDGSPAPVPTTGPVIPSPQIAAQPRGVVRSGGRDHDDNGAGARASAEWERARRSGQPGGKIGRMRV